MTQDFLSQLNDSQRKAVEYIDGASLVIAGAGSGKTRVLTYKIAYLISQGYRPWEIMALTFTNKAAKEMKERIMSLVGVNARYLQMGTFHSIFARILRREAEKIGYSSNYTIYDETDSRSLCKSIVKQLDLDDKIYKPADVHNRISMAKNKLIGPDAYATDTNITLRDRDEKVPQMPLIYKMYVENCRKSNAMDFDDLLFYTFYLFKNNEEVRLRYVEMYHFLLVDEYQDTNFAQQQIVWQLTKERQKVCVVGDDAQSIYGFRGANIDNILDFTQLYEGSKQFKLEQNYRSTQRIVQAANSLIHHNERQIHKDVFSKNDEGDKLTLQMLTSDKGEAINVCRDIRNKVKKEHFNWHDFAILYRTNYQSRTFEEQMLKDSIPYKIYGGMSFYQRKEIKDVIAYFRLVCNPHDEEAFRRIVNYPTRGLGDTTIGKLLSAAQAYGESLWTISSNPTGFGVNVNKGTITKLANFRNLIIGFAERLATDDVFTLGQSIIKDSGISEDIYSGHNPDDTSRQENIEEFIASMQDFVETNREEGQPVGLTDFLQDVSLMSDVESGDAQDDNKVVLMTIHSAKGLEFPVVFVVGMEENIFPSPMCTNSMRELEEERRLLYVAITRAEEKCILTCAKSRYRYGKMEFDSPSRFLRDIDPKLLHIEDMTVSDDEYAPRRSYGGYGGGYSSSKAPSLWGRAGGEASRMQNNRPVADRFMADPKPKITSPRKQEEPVNPYSEAFQNRLRASGANMQKVSSSLSKPAQKAPYMQGFQEGIHSAMNPGTTSAQGRNASVTSSLSTVGKSGVDNIGESGSGGRGFSLTVGAIVEHNRFGIGVVKALEGSGDSAKATVEFRNAGTKQLLLKFAKLKVR